MRNVLAVLLLAMATAAAPEPNTTLRSTGVIVPLYVSPGRIWNEAIAGKYAHPLVPVVIIVNVDNGPGAIKTQNYVAYVKKAQEAGIDVLGYVFTKYGRRSQDEVDAQMLRWYNFYHTDGIFLDQMADGNAAYYQAATAFAHAHALWFVMGNPGVNVPGNSGPDVINFYEQHGYPPLSLLRGSGHASFGKARWSYIADDVPFNENKIRASLNYVGYLYATDGTEPECYCKLPQYYSQLLALLDKD